MLINPTLAPHCRDAMPRVYAIEMNKRKTRNPERRTLNAFFRSLALSLHLPFTPSPFRPFAPSPFHSLAPSPFRSLALSLPRNFERTKCIEPLNRAALERT
jgi:hypothetical protein